MDIILGAGVVALISASLYVLNTWWKDVAAPNLPQTIKLATSKTPTQVMRNAAAARLKIIGFLVVALSVAMTAAGLADILDAAVTSIFGLLFFLFGKLAQS